MAGFAGAALYVPGCVGASPCTGANRQARNPRTGQLLGANSAVAIGQIVPNSGNLTNGIAQAGQGISKYNYTWPAIVVAPRFGMAYDDPRANVVVRGASCFSRSPSATRCIRKSATPVLYLDDGAHACAAAVVERHRSPRGRRRELDLPYEGDIPASRSGTSASRRPAWASSLTRPTSGGCAASTVA